MTLSTFQAPGRAAVRPAGSSIFDWSDWLSRRDARQQVIGRRATRRSPAGVQGFKARTFSSGNSHPETPSRGVPPAADVVAIHGKPGEEGYALPLAWQELPLKPRAVPVRITSQPGAWRMTNQPVAFRGFGSNE